MKNIGLPPQLKASVILLAVLLGCVNRGRNAPGDGGGKGGNNGVGGGGGAAGGTDGGVADAHVDMRGAGGGGAGSMEVRLSLTNTRLMVLSRIEQSSASEKCLR